MRRVISISIVMLALACAQLSLLAQSPAPNQKDRLYQAKGTQHRTYYFKAADEHVPYRLYVPSKWTPTSRMPLLVWINPTLDIDLAFTRGGNILEKLAEERNYIIAVPAGYQRPRPYFNTPYRPVPAKPPAAGATVAPFPQDPRSEQDILNITDLVAAEYNVPADRIYMFANSTAGAGVWYLAHKHPERWAAAGVASAPIALDGYPFERLKTVPFLVVHGDKDETNSFAAAEQDVRTLKQHGLTAEFLPVKDGTHLEAWCLGLPQILDFFDKHRKAKTE
jgi:predicted peptidase